MGKHSITALAMHLDDELGGMRKLRNISDISLSDNGSAEAQFNTTGEFVGFKSSEGGYTCSVTIFYVKGDSSEPDYWALRKNRETVTVTFDFQGGDRVQFDGVLAKFAPKGNNTGEVTAETEWALSAPEVLDKGNVGV